MHKFFTTLLLLLIFSCGGSTNVITDFNEGGLAESPPSKDKCNEFFSSKLDEIDLSDVRTIHNFDELEVDNFRCSNDEFIICHVPSGNVDNSHFIEVGDSISSIESHFREVYLINEEVHRSYLLRCSVYDSLPKIQNVRPCSIICDE